jgi:phosphate transport system permease protein
MAIEHDKTVDFGTVSRVKGRVFKALSFGASVIGIVSLAVLLIYVFMDAFDLTNASPEWLLTYYLTIVLPLVGFCLYSAGDRALTRQTVLALGGGLLATAVLFTGFEQLIRPIPALTWQLAYLFLVVVPVTGYVIFLGSREPVGRTGFGLVGRLLGGGALGVAFSILFIVFDPLLWFFAYTLGVVPAAAVYVASRSHPSLSPLVAPVGVAGVIVGTLVQPVVSVYPTADIIFLWTFAVPLAVTAAGLTYARDSHLGAVAVAGGVPLVAGAAGLAVGDTVLPSGTTVVLLAVPATVVTVYVSRVVESREGTPGLALPVILVAGTLVGTLLVETFGFSAPDSWLNLSYVTSAHSQTAVDAGLYPAIVGSVIIIALVAVISFVLGVGTAVLLEEYTSDSGWVGRITRLIQINIANLAAVPSVVYGLLGLALFANLLGFGYGTAVTASLTLGLLILPITIISAQEAIRAVPDEMRRGSDAMGATRWQTTKNVVLPQAFPGILTGIILALGRAIGETAPLIMIGAATTVFSAPDSLWSTFSAMPMQIFAWSDYFQEEFRYGVVAAGVVTLLIVLLGMNATAIILRNRAESGALPRN